MAGQYFIGIDVSKASLQCAIMHRGEILLNEKVDNTTDSLKAFLKRIKKNLDAGGPGSVYCLESTGNYKEPLVQVLGKKRGIRLCVENPLRIKRSLGLQRGKSDKIDSVRIATYAFQNKDKLLLHQDARPLLEQL